MTIEELQAKNAILSTEVERIVAENAHLHKGIYSLSLNVVQLKDEVERLTKAGDAMEDAIIHGGLVRINEARYGWEAAKEGKPNA